MNRKLLGDRILRALKITGNIFSISLILYLARMMDLSLKLIVESSFHDVYKSDHYAVHLKLSAVLYVNYICVKLEEEKKTLHSCC